MERNHERPSQGGQRLLGVAQMVAYLVRDQGVAGSIPATQTA